MLIKNENKNKNWQILWPEGTFFLKLRTSQTDSSQSKEGSCRTPSGSKANNNKQGSFEEQLEATRRASEIKKMIFSEYSLFYMLNKMSFLV